MSTPTATTDPVAKGNDYAVEALKQLLTLSTVVLALTITFLKDALGDARHLATFTWLVPLAWLCLLIVIWLAWVAIGDAARAMASGKLTGYAFAGAKRWMVRVPHWSFLVALILLALFGMINLKLLFSLPAQRVADEIRAHQFTVVDKAGNIVWKAP